MKHIKPLNKNSVKNNIEKVDEMLLYKDIPTEILYDLVPSGFLNILNDEDKENVQKLKKQIKDMLNDFWKKNKISRKIK